MLRLACFLLGCAAVKSFCPVLEKAKILRPNAFELSSVAPMQDSSPTRRGFLSSSVTGVLAGSCTAFLRPDVSLAEDALVDFEDPSWKFSVKVPAGWETSVQSLPDRRRIVLYIKPDSNQKTLFFIAYTPVRADFTSLGSFGSVDAVSCTCLCDVRLDSFQEADTSFLYSGRTGNDSSKARDCWSYGCL
jgi:hypothetical protein